MNSQLFFILNLVIGALFLVWFLSARKGGGGGPTRLRLKDRAREEADSSPLPSESSTSPVKRGAKSETPAAETEPEKPVEKSLNVLFLYNGHDWDAYAVLGLPAGASLPVVTRTYQDLIQGADQGKSEFYEAAYRAILKKT